MTTTTNRLEQLITLLEEARDDHGFDKIIIDNTSGANYISLNHLACSEKSILVVRPTRYDIENAYHQIHDIYKKLPDLIPGSKRNDFLAWNQVPIPPDSTELYTIHSYIADWTDKFAEANLEHATTIPYWSNIATEMIVYTTINLVKISHLLEKYIDELINKLER